MAKSLIVFGAGASFDSEVDGVIVPPLGGRLFDELAAFNPPGWGTLNERYGQAFRDDFEGAMAQYGNDYPGNITRLQRAMAAFFYKYRPSSASLYQQMACDAKSVHWNGAFVTFNYEQLLPMSIANAGYQCVVGQAPQNPDKQIELCLPHGYCRLVCDSVQAHDTTMFANCQVDGPVREVSDEEFEKRINTEAVPPVMSYFIPSKDTMSGVSFIKGQKARYAKLVAEADRVAIVGLRVREHDVHVWEPLAATNAAILYCSGLNSGSEFEKWTKAHRQEKNNIIIPKYFRDGFSELSSFIGLKPI